MNITRFIHTSTPSHRSRLASPPSVSAQPEQGRDTVQISQRALQATPKARTGSGFLRSAGLVALTGISLAGGLLGGASVAEAQTANSGTEVIFSRQDYNDPVSFQELPGRPSGGTKFDYTRAEVEQAVQNNVTADDLLADDFRFSAVGVDEMQASKVYHDPSELSPREEGYKGVKHDNRLLMCNKTNRSGDRCSSKLSTETSHSILSCIYRNEADGDLYRVIQRSESHTHSQQMNKNVCAGHQLRKTGGVWTPHQHNEDGDTLYVNPDNIIQVQTLTPAESARFGQ